MQDNQNQNTRGRLIEAAGEVFAEIGLHEAGIEEICLRAGVDSAVANSHFGSKEDLYGTVLRHTLGSSVDKYPFDLDLGGCEAAESVLFAFVRSLLRRFFDEKRPAWHGKLMAREIADHTKVLDEIIEEAVRPIYEHLRTIVLELLENTADEEIVRLCSMSILGQCIFYHHSRALTERLYQHKLNAADIDRLARHITLFSIGAMQKLGNSSGGA